MVNIWETIYEILDLFQMVLVRSIDQFASW